MSGSAPAVWSAEDRSLRIEPGQIVRTAWVPLEKCKIGNRARMAPEAVEAKFRRLLCQGEAACWPPITGVWEGDIFTVWDGRHEYVASLMIGREQVFVAWIEQQDSVRASAPE